MRGEHERAVSSVSGFDFTHHMRNVCEDIVTRLPEMRHIDFRRVAVSFSQARKGSHYGIHASLTPMRFVDGARVNKRRGRYYTTQRVLDPDGQEMLYILSFYLPRFMNVDLREKLTTIIHELWHISPSFDGDIRRHAGRCYAHTGSKNNYDAAMQQLADRWLELGPPPTVHHFLRYRFDELQRLYGHVYGMRVRRPKLLPISADEARRIARETHAAG